MCSVALLSRGLNYIYKECMTTRGTDVKVYTVGPRWVALSHKKALRRVQRPMND